MCVSWRTKTLGLDINIIEMSRLGAAHKLNVATQVAIAHLVWSGGLQCSRSQGLELLERHHTIMTTIIILYHYISFTAQALH